MRLNRNKVRPPAAKPWTSTMINKMLRNPRYAGMVSYSDRHRLDPSKAWDGWSLVLFDDDGHPLLGSWDPIVSPKAWSQVQFELQLRRQKRGLAPGTHRNPIAVRYLLSGILKCRKCGWGLVGTKYRPRSCADKIRGYRCPTSAHGGCGGTHIVAHAAEEAVEQVIEVFLHNVPAESAEDEPPSPTALNTLCLTVGQEIERKQGMIRRWTDGSLSEAGLTEDDHFQMLAGSSRKISGLREAITSAEGVPHRSYRRRNCSTAGVEGNCVNAVQS